MSVAHPDLLCENGSMKMIRLGYLELFNISLIAYKGRQEASGEKTAHP